MDETASGDDFGQSTFIEGLTNNISPSHQFINKLFCFNTRSTKNIVEDLSLGFLSRIFLFHSDRETLKERFVHNVGTDKAAIVRTLTLGVCCSNHIETIFRMNKAINLLEEDRLAFKHRLETHQFIRTKVNLVKKKDSTTRHSHDNRTVLPYSLTINKSETTDKVIFVCFNSNIDTDTFTLFLSANLFNHHSLTVTRKTGNIGRIKLLGLDNSTNVGKVTERYVTRSLFRHKGDFGTGASGRSHRNSRIHSDHRISHRNNGLNISSLFRCLCLRRSIYTMVSQSINTTTNTERNIIEQPVRTIKVILFTNLKDLSTGDFTDSTIFKTHLVKEHGAINLLRHTRVSFHSSHYIWIIAQGRGFVNPFLSH